VQSYKSLPSRQTRGASSLNEIGGVCADFLEENRAGTAEEAAQGAGPILFNKTLRLPSIMISQKS
jgi:hypothetical protein